MENFKLYDGEYRFMDLIWRLEPINSTQLAKAAFLELGWKKSTCYTVLKKLKERGFIKNEQALVTALVLREDVQRFESETVVEKNFGGSLPAFISTFLTGKKLSREEAEEIQRMIEEASR